MDRLSSFYTQDTHLTSLFYLGRKTIVLQENPLQEGRDKLNSYEVPGLRNWTKAAQQQEVIVLTTGPPLLVPVPFIFPFFLFPNKKYLEITHHMFTTQILQQL